MLSFFYLLFNSLIFTSVLHLQLCSASPVDRDTPSGSHATHSIQTDHSNGAAAVPPDVIVPYHWSADPTHCATTACLSDCQMAASQLCSSPSLAQPLLNITVKDCTALYLYSPNNPPPTRQICLSNYNQILASSKQSASKCGGGIGGAIGYLKNGKRARDSPLYAVYDKNGNGNCLKQKGDETRVLAENELADGTVLKQCATVATARRRSREPVKSRKLAPRVLSEIGKRQSAAQDACSVAKLTIDSKCNAACIQVVTTTSYFVGPLAIAAGLACLGPCASISLNVAQECLDSQFSHVSVPQSQTAEDQDMVNPCLNINTWDWGQCSASKSTIQASEVCALDGQGIIQW